MMDKPGRWRNITGMVSRSYTCGFCGNRVGVEFGYLSDPPFDCYIYLCAFCNQPTYFDSNGVQYPAPMLGGPIHEAPEDLVLLYDEARRATSVGAYTAAVMCCRKLLMNLAVKENAEEGKSYKYYVDYLEENHFLPPKSRTWVDAIRLLGNEANHEIDPKTQREASLALTFSEMLLKYLYEYPAAASDSG